MNTELRLQTKKDDAKKINHACAIHVDRPDHEYEYIPDFLEC